MGQVGGSLVRTRLQLQLLQQHGQLRHRRRLAAKSSLLMWPRGPQQS
jgi:hypothetical protein